MKKFILTISMRLSLLFLLAIILTSCQNLNLGSGSINSRLAGNDNKSFEFQKWRIESSTKGGVNGIWDVYSLDSDGKVKYEEILRQI